jgi:hypothetical protein
MCHISRDRRLARRNVRAELGGNGRWHINDAHLPEETASKISGLSMLFPPRARKRWNVHF